MPKIILVVDNKASVRAMVIDFCHNPAGSLCYYRVIGIILIDYLETI
jgi:hypothetical protein